MKIKQPFPSWMAALFHYLFENVQEMTGIPLKQRGITTIFSFCGRLYILLSFY